MNLAFRAKSWHERSEMDALAGRLVALLYGSLEFTAVNFEPGRWDLGGQNNWILQKVDHPNFDDIYQIISCHPRGLESGSIELKYALMVLLEERLMVEVLDRNKIKREIFAELSVQVVSIPRNYF